MVLAKGATAEANHEHLRYFFGQPLVFFQQPPSLPICRKNDIHTTFSLAHSAQIRYLKITSSFYKENYFYLNRHVFRFGKIAKSLPANLSGAAGRTMNDPSTPERLQCVKMPWK
jgi:hypothetical protein